MLNVNAYSLGLHGLLIIYEYKGQKTTLLLDPKATCQTFEDLRIIESFETDSNGEPMILWQDKQFGRPVIEHCLWCEFISSFPCIKRHAEIIIEDRERRKVSRWFHAKIDHLLSPLKAA
jgi:hypothetical protein